MLYMLKNIFRGLIILRLTASPTMPSFRTIVVYWENSLYTNAMCYAPEKLVYSRLKQNLNNMYSF